MRVATLLAVCVAITACGTDKPPAPASKAGSATDIPAGSGSAASTGSSITAGSNGSGTSGTWRRKDFATIGKDDDQFPLKGSLELPEATTTDWSRGQGPDDVPVTTVDLKLPRVQVSISELDPIPKVPDHKAAEHRITKDGGKLLDTKRGDNWFVIAYDDKSTKRVYGEISGAHGGMVCMAATTDNEGLADAIRVCSSITSEP
ncbi:MAG: hypothetical protein AB7O24_02755 [Kofleriaceae bacterium]